MWFFVLKKIGHLIWVALLFIIKAGANSGLKDQGTFHNLRRQTTLQYKLRPLGPPPPPYVVTFTYWFLFQEYCRHLRNRPCTWPLILYRRWHLDNPAPLVLLVNVAYEWPSSWKKCTSLGSSSWPCKMFEDSSEFQISSQMEWKR